MYANYFGIIKEIDWTSTKDIFHVELWAKITSNPLLETKKKEEKTTRPTNKGKDGGVNWVKLNPLTDECTVNISVFIELACLCAVASSLICDVTCYIEGS